jgi:hypothetical protein
MEISKFSTRELRNEEHNEFMSEFKIQVEQVGDVKLGVKVQFADFKTAYATELSAIQTTRKSAFTEQLEAADAARDESYRGFDACIGGLCNHFNESSRQAAKRIRLVLDQRGDVPNLGYDAESSVINNIVSELNSLYAADVASLSLTNWIADLQAKNNVVIALSGSRDKQEAVKCQIAVTTSRRKVDLTYKALVKQLNALILVNGETAYKSFVETHNQRIARYKMLIEQRAGRNAAKKDKPSDSDVAPK